MSEDQNEVDEQQVTEDVNEAPEVNPESEPVPETPAPIIQPAVVESAKTVNNTSVAQAEEQVGDLEVFGNGDLFQLLSKASSKEENWMKSTKAMQIEGVGCVVQVTTQQGDNVAEALTFVPGVKIGRAPMSKDKVLVRI